MLCVMRTRLAAVLGLLSLTGCMRVPRSALPPAPAAAQHVLEAFARALGAWDVAGMEGLLVGGAAHPAWQRQRERLEGRGIRFAEVRTGKARQIRPEIAVGPVRFRLVGGATDDRPRVAQVALLRLVNGWRVSFWGTRFAVKRHLRWVAMGGDPLKDPSFRYFR
jgi:hypothetical protein